MKINYGPFKKFLKFAKNISMMKCKLLARN